MTGIYTGIGDNKFLISFALYTTEGIFFKVYSYNFVSTPKYTPNKKYVVVALLSLDKFQRIVVSKIVIPPYYLNSIRVAGNVLCQPNNGEIKFSIERKVTTYCLVAYTMLDDALTRAKPNFLSFSEITYLNSIHVLFSKHRL